MKKTLRWLGMLAIGAAMLGGFGAVALAQGTPPAASPAGTGGPTDQYGGNTGQSQATSATEAEPGTELPVLFVTSVEIMRTQTQPQLDVVRVTGLTGSQGWTSPELVPTYVGKPLDGILDLQFIATMPLQTETATGFVPFSAVFPLEEGHDFKGVRVRGSENAIEVDQIPGTKTANISLNDCKDCVGKKFAERGQAAPGASGVVRQEDLPKILRWIPPTHGIRGITHNPNRLNLLLGTDNTIIAAYWE
ncbi:MAG TPA: hypothetical protein VMS01_16510 [Stellaceae bacterium]|jgi:hypothetical protein|nr:hypothetical protein [Stellaceae bacterium]